MFVRMLKPNLNSSSLPYNLIFYTFEFAQLQTPNLAKNFSVQPTNSKSDEYKKKTSIVPKITLLSGNDLTITTLGDAQKLARRRDLKLVKILDIDTKTHRPVYKLMTGAEYHEEDLKQREEKKLEKQKKHLKGEKVLIIGQNISQHDLHNHCSKIIKWLEKKFEVRTVINGDAENIQKAEAVYSFLEEKLIDHGRIIYKRQKGSDIKFQVFPPKENSSTNNNNNNKDVKDST